MFEMNILLLLLWLTPSPLESDRNLKANLPIRSVIELSIILQGANILLNDQGEVKLGKESAWHLYMQCSFQSQENISFRAQSIISSP